MEAKRQRVLDLLHAAEAMEVSMEATMEVMEVRDESWGQV